MLRKLLIAPHMTYHMSPNDMGFETHGSDVSAPWWVAEIYSNTLRRNIGGVCGQVLSTERHFAP